MSEPMLKAALTDLDSQPITGRLVGACLAGGVLAGLLAAADKLMNLGLGWRFVALALPVTSALEWRIWTEAQRRLRPARAFIKGLIEAFGEAGGPLVGWRRGLPYLRGTCEAGLFAVYLDPVRPEGLRLNLSLQADAGVHLLLVSKQADDVPEKWLDKLVKHHRHERIEADDAVHILSMEAVRASTIAESSAWLESMKTLVCCNGGCSATADFHGDSAGFDTKLTELMTPQLVSRTLSELGRLAVEARALAPAPVEVLDALEGVESPEDEAPSSEA